MKKKQKNNRTIIRRKTALKITAWVTILGFSLLLIFILLIQLGAFGSLPDELELKQVRNNQATEIISVDNKLLGRYYYQNRTNASLDEIPSYLIDALVATEDVRFFRHAGLDIRSTLRVIVKSIILRDKSAGGGSTISQQLAKNLYPRKNHGILTMPVSKIKEIITARRLEDVYSKEEILELYLNTVSFGENAYGIETAALIYFSKTSSQLSIEESALMIGLLKANTSYNPRIHVKASTRRRNTVLSQMARYGYLSKEKADSISNLPVQLDYQPLTHTEGPAPYFREHLRHELLNILKDLKKPDGSDYSLYADGLVVYTTVNYTMQRYAEQAVKEHLTELQNIFDKHWKNREPWKKNPNLARLQMEQSKAYQAYRETGLSHTETMDALKKRRKSSIYDPEGDIDTLIAPLDSILHHFKSLQTGVLIMNPNNGDVLTWIGGPRYKYFKYDHVKARRQAGSVFKPIVYAAAVERGTSPCTMYANDSVVYEDYDNWTPQNADRTYGGYYSVKGALANSVNTVSAKMLMEIGFEPTINLAKEMGIRADLPKVPSLALGTGEISLFEIVQTYCVFANRGRKVSPRMIRRIENANGQVIYSNAAHEPGDSVLSKATAETMLAMLQGTVDRGTAKSLRTIWGIESELAGKTGTTQNQTDGWFTCIIPNMVIGVWVGGDNPVVRFRSLSLGQGGYTALPITARFLRKLYKDPLYKYLGNSSFNLPDEVYQEMDCPDFEEEYKETLIDFSVIKEEGVREFIKKIFGKKKKDQKKKNRKNTPSEIETEVKEKTE
jgi:penicillin-binding protein 1A